MQELECFGDGVGDCVEQLEQQSNYIFKAYDTLHNVVS